MSLENIVESLGHVHQWVKKIKDPALQESLASHSDAMMRTIFDHCQALNRAKVQALETKSKVKFPSTAQQIPSLADPAIKNVS